MTKYLSRSELKMLIRNAAVLKTLGEMPLRETLDAIVEGDLGGHELLSLEDARAIAEGVGIPEEYFLQAIKRYPPVEKQKEDVIRYNAKPAIEFIRQTYVNSVLHTFSASSPSEEFYLGGDSSDVIFRFYSMYISTTTRKGWFGRRKIETLQGSPKRVGTLVFRSGPTQNIFSLEVHALEPAFLSVCGDEILKLNERFGAYLSGYSVVRYYDVIGIT